MLESAKLGFGLLLLDAINMDFDLFVIEAELYCGELLALSYQ